MRQRNIAKRTKSIEVAVGGSVESQYLIGAAAPRGHSMSSHSSGRGVDCQSSRCAGRTRTAAKRERIAPRSEEHTSELQSQSNLVCRLLLEKKKKTTTPNMTTTRVA